MMTASATRQQSPSRTLASPSTALSDPQLHAPRITPSPTCCEPTEVAIDLSTTLLIQDYPRFYDTPILEFYPVYSALPDGSLIAPPFTNDLARSYLSLLVTAMLATLFLRNIIVCFDYLHRAKMKRRILFYLLLCSQLLSLGLVPLLASYFSVRLDCTAVVFAASIATGISLALLMTGVLGLKAYRCLDSSLLVLFVLVAFFCASSTFLILQLASIRGVRRLSGGCSTIPHNPRFVRIYVLIQLAHSAFLSCCFFYAVWKSRSSPAARGRLSLRVTLDDFPNVKFDKPIRRLWWQKLLGLENSSASLPALDASGSATGAADRPHSFNIARPASRHNVPDPILEPLNPVQEEAKEPGAPYHTPTSLSRLMPRMELFHRVMKDELCYTTTITVTTVILALLLVFGVDFQNDLDMMCWVATNWAIISILVIHSFGRVIRRHEKDALFQHPSAWWHERDINHRSPYSRRAFPGSQLRIRMPEDPFSDVRAIRESVTSWNSDFSSDSPSSPSPVASARDRRPSLPSPYPSGRHSLLDSAPRDGADRTPSRLSRGSTEEKTVPHVKYAS